MKRSIVLIILFLIVLVLGCASVKVDYVYDPETDFAALKSYNWLPVPSKNIRYPLIMKQIRHEMNRQLKVRNFKLLFTVAYSLCWLTMTGCFYRIIMNNMR
jgi:hypothetical protein